MSLVVIVCHCLSLFVIVRHCLSLFSLFSLIAQNQITQESKGPVDFDWGDEHDADSNDDDDNGMLFTSSGSRILHS